MASHSGLFLVSLGWPPVIAWGSLEWAAGWVTIKIIIVGLLVLLGVGMIALAPMVDRYVGESTFGIKLPQRTGSTQPAQEHQVTATLARIMRVVGWLLILSGLGIGLLWRVKAPIDSL